MKRKLIFLVLIIWFCSSISFAQEKVLDLKDQKITIKMDKQPLGYVFSYLMENYDVAIGFEQSVLDREHNDYNFHTNLPAVGVKKGKSADKSVEYEFEAEVVFSAKNHLITVNAANAKLSEVFDQIVGQMKNYKWEVNDGVVNIFPIQGRDERFEKLLGMNVNNFAFKKGDAITELTSNLMKLSEFKRFVIENKLHFTGVRAGMDIIVNAQYGRKLETEMNFSNLSFRDLLNKITKIKRGGWILKRIKSPETVKEEYVDIDI